jgi:hypothetical protein
MARANLGMLRLAEDNVLLKADYSGRRILPAIFFGWLLVYLDDRSVINPTAQEPAHPERIRNPAVCGQVKTARRSVSELLTELGRVHVRTSAKVPSDQKFAATLDCGETVRVANTASDFLAERGGLLAVNELPDFVGLNVDHPDALNGFGHPRFALGANRVTKVDDGSILNAGNAGNTANGHSLTNQRENLNGHVHAQPHAVKSLGEGRPALAAYLAAEADRAALVAFRDSSGLSLIKAEGIKNVFVLDWKPKFFSNRRKKLASIPFMRNLVEYTSGESDPDFSLLTSLLHLKPDSRRHTIHDLNELFARMFSIPGPGPAVSDAKLPVIDAIENEASVCLTAAADGLNLDNKVVLAIGIRLAAEEFMIKAINDPKFVSEIPSNQTQSLLTRYRDDFPAEQKAIQVLQRVVLMTPENIHLNSFMYEPILDMSDEHLRQLYRDILALGDPAPKKPKK